ncbi:MAG: hypothetical protein ACREBU_22955, partial [Nitrososphaera sp.]
GQTMSRILSRLIMAMLIGLVILIFPAMLAAQSFWLERSQGKTFLLEIFKPDIGSGVYNGVSYPVDYSFETVALFLSLRSQIGSKSFLMVELPFAHAAFNAKNDSGFSFYRNRGSSSTIGNPYLGLELGGTNARFFTEVGIRLPLAETDNNYAARVGRAADSDRPEAFEDYVTLRAVINYRSKRTKGLMFRARGGALVQRNFNHSDNHFSIPIDALIGYGYEKGRFRLGVNFVINIDASYRRYQRYINNYYFSSSFNINQTQLLRLTGNVRLGSLRAGAHLKPPFLDSERENSFDLTRSSFGLDLAIQR